MVINTQGQKTSLSDYGPGVPEEGQGAEDADFEWSWGEPVSENVDQATFAQMWNNREFTDGAGMSFADMVANSQSASQGIPAGGTIKGLDKEQSNNLRIILEVGRRRGLNQYAQTIAVLTALGESGMRNLNYGDRDSIGMFQERAIWGSRKSRLDPWQTANRFYDRLTKVRGWRDMRPTIAAHKAQRNADPNHYTRWWKQAAGLVAAAYGR